MVGETDAVEGRASVSGVDVMNAMGYGDRGEKEGDGLVSGGDQTTRDKGAIAPHARVCLCVCGRN